MTALLLLGCSQRQATAAFEALAALHEHFGGRLLIPASTYAALWRQLRDDGSEHAPPTSAIAVSVVSSSEVEMLTGTAARMALDHALKHSVTVVDSIGADLIKAAVSDLSEYRAMLHALLRMSHQKDGRKVVALLSLILDCKAALVTKHHWQSSELALFDSSTHSLYHLFPVFLMPLNTVPPVRRIVSCRRTRAHR